MSNVNLQVPVAKPPNRQYDVLFSYAGENRQYVSEVVAALKLLDVRVFYDRDEDFWGKDLPTELATIYETGGWFCVVFISEAYKESEWTRLELKSTLVRALREKREYLLPARFDDTELPDVPSRLGYEDLRKTTADRLAILIARKVARLKKTGHAWPWWRRFPERAAMALLAMLIMIAAVVNMVWTSHTDFEITNAEREFILISVENTGRRPSTLKSYKLTFDKKDMKVAQDYLALTPLQEGTERSQPVAVIRPGTGPPIKLAAESTLKATCSPVEVCRDEVLKQLASRPLTLSIDIQESGKPWQIWRVFNPKPYNRPESHPIPDQLRENIKYFLSGACCDEQP